ncbi:hypothetical protein SAY86_024586 [Trapa natans]|uniref:Uncharacterized protein n=1 Tax=Trapa natans TaxID=22666 RepID=A0AAN7MQ61_TRANT|nr:hypothetical protein SAY86_024586 [Trapa natans]
MHPIIWETVASSRNTAGGLCICTTGYCNKEILGCMAPELSVLLSSVAGHQTGAARFIRSVRLPEDFLSSQSQESLNFGKGFQIQECSLPRGGDPVDLDKYYLGLGYWI